MEVIKANQLTVDSRFPAVLWQDVSLESQGTQTLVIKDHKPSVGLHAVSNFFLYLGEAWGRLRSV